MNNLNFDPLKSFPLSQASAIAVSICDKLNPYCDRINIAGSIRRKKISVKDIEIICSPLMAKHIEMETPPVLELFTEPDIKSLVKETWVISPEFEKTVLSLGTVIKGKPSGRYMQILLPEGIKLDLFMPDWMDYYRQYAIRTGPAEFAAKMLAIAWRRLGWCGSDQGLRLMSECEGKKDGSGKIKWKCTAENPTLPPTWINEMDFFKWLGLEWIEPTKRF